MTPQGWKTPVEIAPITRGGNVYIMQAPADNNINNK